MLFQITKRTALEDAVLGLSDDTIARQIAEECLQKSLATNEISNNDIIHLNLTTWENMGRLVTSDVGTT